MQAQSKYFTVAPPFDYDNNRGKRIRVRCNVQLRDGSMKCWKLRLQNSTQRNHGDNKTSFNDGEAGVSLLRGKVMTFWELVCQSPEHTSMVRRALGMTMGVQEEWPHCSDILLHWKATSF